MLIYGINPVLEALKAGRATALTVTRRGGERLDEILRMARARGLAVHRVDGAALDRMARGGVHQGVVAEAVAAPSYRSPISSAARRARPSSSCSTASRIRTTSGRFSAPRTRPVPTA